MNAVIFDLDGTLWDSSKEVTESWNVVTAKYHACEIRRLTVNDMHGFMGKPMDEIARLMMPNVEESLRNKIMLECMDFELEYLSVHKPEFYPRLLETLEELHKKYALIIVSNCQDGYIQLFLKQLNKDLFCDFESFGRTGLSKGGNIRLVIKRNNIENAVYLGDTQGDLDASDEAEIPFIHAGYGFGMTNRKTMAISQFCELPKICGEIFND